MADDLISRQAAVDALQEEINKGIPPFDDVIGSIRCGVRLARNIIEDIPPAQQWIPVSERLPKNDDWVIVTILDERGDTPFKYTDFGWYLEEANCWIIGAEQREDVTAWMPLPEPYKEDKNDADVC